LLAREKGTVQRYEQVYWIHLKNY